MKQNCKIGALVKLTLISLALLMASAVALPAQSLKERAEENMEALRKRADENMAGIRQRANENFVRLLSGKWKEDITVTPPDVPEEPRQEPVPVVPEEDRDKEVKDNTIPIKEVVEPVAPAPAPQPIEPVVPVVPKEPKHFRITFFGTPLDYLFDASGLYKGPLDTPEDVAAAWESMANENFDNLLSGMLKTREELDLCDWAYYLLAQEISEKAYGSCCSGSGLLTFFLMCQSGYDAIIVRTVSDGKLYCCVASDYNMFYKPSFDIDGTTYYFLGNTEITGKFNVFPYKFPETSRLRLPMLQKNLFAAAPKNSKAFGNTESSGVQVNGNALDFYATYPRSVLGEDIGSQWLFYAQAPLSSTARASLYPTLKLALSGKSEYDKVSILLKFLQDDLEYRKDDEVWGGDRAFFPEETLYYPYQDCEDRAILMSRLVRDLVNLDCVLIYYEGHLAMAVNFNENVSGDNVVVDGKKYVICDPCYIPAPVGMGVDLKIEKVIKLPRI